MIKKKKSISNIEIDKLSIINLFCVSKITFKLTKERI